VSRQQIRAEALAEAADLIVRYCPEHGSEDEEERRMECACDLADEIRELVDKANPTTTEEDQ